MKRSRNEGSSCRNASTAFSAPTKCIQILLNMQNYILQMEESVCQSELVVKDQQELLCICSRAVAHLKMLFKEELLNIENYIFQKVEYVFQGKPFFKELLVVEEQEELLCICSSVVTHIEMLLEEVGQSISPSTLSAMEETSSFHFPTTEITLCVITNCLNELLKMQQLIHLSQGEFLDTQQQEDVLCIKSSAGLLNILSKGTEEADDEAMDMDWEGKSYESSDKSWDGVDPAASGSNPQQVEESFKLRFKEEDRVWSSMKEQEISDKERYLCISNGFEIWCLDLKQSHIKDPRAPRIDTLDLLGGRLPASVGLFKLNSHAYMIGGQILPASVKNPRPCLYADVPKGNDLYHALCDSEGIKGSYHLTHRLSLDAGHKLAYSATTDIEKLKKPKVWPIVEKIDKKLHVMDSVPLGFRRSDDDDWIFTHEVRNLKGEGEGESEWNEIIPTIEGSEHIHSHVVVGNRIFAVTDAELGCNNYYLEFDSQTEKWKDCTRGEVYDPFEARRVWHILPHGITKCVGEYLYSNIPEEENARLYVVVALVRKGLPCHLDGIDTLAPLAVAYLVTSTGLVLCYQRLPNFFTGPLRPFHVGGGTIIHVEAEWGTMCSVISATLVQDMYRLVDYLFVNTFSVELCHDVHDKVEPLVKKASGAEHKYPAPEELEFVRLIPKDWYIFQPDDDLDYGFMDRESLFVGWQACFLTPP